MADSTLAAIRTKVRRLTRSPSEEQISTADIDEYVNTFIQYDFPQELRLFTLRKTMTWYTSPGTDLYETDAGATAPLTNFRNIYTAVHKPIYIGGYEAYFSQSEGEFYGMYPLTNTVVEENTGDGVGVAFTGTLASVPVTKNHVVFTSTIATGEGITLFDDGGIGHVNNGSFDGDGTGTINYDTGAYAILFTNPPANGAVIYSHTIPYTAARPDTILYFDNNFIVRPIPDIVYPVQIEVDMRPSELLAAGTSPDLEQWWQYIAYGASKKVFEDRTDVESLGEILPEFKKQELLVLRKTIVTQSKERSSTIYSDGNWIGYGSSWGRNRS